MSTILLTGANGNVSTATIHALQGKGHRLIGLVRDKAKASSLEALGVELRTGDLEQLRTLEGGAFDGVDVAWVLTPPGPLAPLQSSNAVWAARQAGVKHIVRMSAIGAGHDAPSLNGRMHALSDSELERSGTAYTILKPHFFMQNVMMGAQSVAQQGALYLALGGAAVPMIDARDVGAAAAAVLADPGSHAGQTYTLTGPRAITGDEVAGALGAALGKEVRYVPVPVSAVVETIAAMGMSDFLQTMMRDYFVAYSRGWMSEVTPWVERLTGAAPRDVAAFASDFAGAFGGRAS